jgi:hypothetical protein
MAITLILHIENSEPVMGEVEDLPGPSDRLIKLSSPRRVDNKDLPYLMENVNTVIWPVDKINFIEILSNEEEERIIGFVRE